MDYWEIEPGSFDGVMQEATDAAKLTNTTFDALKKFKELFSSGKAMDPNQANELIIELQGQMADLKMANANLKIQLAEMKNAATQAAEKKQRIDRYELIKTTTGRFVYRLKTEHQTEEPEHHICPQCYEEQVKSILQGGEKVKTCPRCATEFNFKPISIKTTYAY